MATVLNSSLLPIISQIKAEVVASTGLDVSQVRIAQKKIPQFTTQTDVILQFSRAIYPSEWQNPAGRIATVARRILAVHVRVSDMSDSSDTDEVWLTDPLVGEIQLEERVIGALQLFFPTDSDNNGLLYEPMHIVDSDDPQKLSESNSNPSFGEAIAHFSILYALPLNNILA